MDRAAVAASLMISTLEDESRVGIGALLSIMSGAGRRLGV